MPLNYILFVQIILFLFITPGTPRILMASYAISYGMKKTSLTAMGDISANVVQMVAVTFMIGSLIIKYPQILIIIKWFGVIYLCYLAYEIFKSNIKNFDKLDIKPSKKKLSFFIDGFFVAVMSPKAIVFFGTIFPNFIDFNKNYVSQFVILAVTYIILDFITLIIYGLSARKISLWLKTNPRTINIISSVALLIIAFITAFIRI